MQRSSSKLTTCPIRGVGWLDSNRKALPLLMSVRKSLKIIIDYSQSFRPNLSQLRTFRKLCKDLPWLGEFRLSKNLFFKHSASQAENPHPVCYWPIMNNSLAKICQFLTSSVSEVQVMTCSMSIEQKLCWEKIFRLQSMPNSRMRDIACRSNFAVKLCQSFGVTFLTSIFGLSNPKLKFN